VRTVNTGLWQATALPTSALHARSGYSTFVVSPCSEFASTTARTLFTPHIGSAVDVVPLEIELEAAHYILQTTARRNPVGVTPSEASNCTPAPAIA